MHRKLLFTLSFLFCIQIISAQDITLIDTADSDLHQDLSKIYNGRVDNQLKVFDSKFKKRKLRKKVTAYYEDFSDGFKEQIDEQQFVSHPEYERFVNSILEKLQKHNPEYKNIKDTKILFQSATTPNAYAIGNEIVVLHLPLLKKVENEYELAFILSHEISHNLLKHSFKSMEKHAKTNTSKTFKKKTRKIRRQRYNRSTDAEKLFRDIVYDFTNHNRSVEEQADSLGYVLYKNAYPDFAAEPVNNLLNLDQIDKETDSLTTEDFISFLDYPEGTITEDLLDNDELSANYDYSSQVWEIDSLKTHPDSKIRAKTLQNNYDLKIDSVAPPSAEFEKIKSSAAFNDILGLYKNEEYGYALFQSLLLLKSNPDNSFLKNIIHDLLLEIQEARRSYKVNKHVARLSPQFSQDYNTLIYLLRNLRLKQLENIANHYKA